MSQTPMAIYIGLLMVISFVFRRYMLNWWWMAIGLIEVIAFFHYSFTLTRRWLKIRQRRVFEKRLFWTGFLLRFVVMTAIYIAFQTIYDNPYGFENGDATFYNELGNFCAYLIRNGNFHFYDEISKYATTDFSDMGYGIYVGFIYFLTGNSIFMVRLFKCVWGAITAVLIYRIAERNFGESTGRMSGIFCMLFPNFWYYSSTHLKETEMLFLGVLFVYLAEDMLRGRKFTAHEIIPVLLTVVGLFGFRTPLALVALLSLVFTIVISSTKVISWGKRILIGGLAIALIVLAFGNRLQEEAAELMNKAGKEHRDINLQFRADRANGNAFSKYATSTVMAPLIFTIPFPTMVETPQQEVQKINHGGNYIKNILSGCVILLMFIFLLTGKWRDHVLPLSFMLGYLVVLVFSSFAHSERFHQPAMPFELMFAACMICNVQRKHRQWFLYWQVFIIMTTLAWQWFKLKGRGM